MHLCHTFHHVFHGFGSAGFVFLLQAHFILSLSHIKIKRYSVFSLIALETI